MVGFANASMAGDDKDKKKNSNQPSKTSKCDSTLLDVDIDAPDTEDTLVFEDWDNPDGGGTIGTDPSHVASGFNLDAKHSGMHDSRNFNNAMLDKLKDFKKDYEVSFTVYPNPTVSRLNIRTDNIPNDIRVSDIMGRVHLISSYTTEISVGDLPTGTYVIQLVYNDHIESRKFVKN